MKAEIETLWTPADLAARWRCSVPVALDRVRACRVPFVWLGKGEAKLTGRGAKLVRFRPKAVEQWEAGHEGYWDRDAARPEAPAGPVPSAGLLRGRKAR